MYIVTLYLNCTHDSTLYLVSNLKTDLLCGGGGGGGHMRGLDLELLLNKLLILPDLIHFE